MITGIVLARNEETQIEACLESFRPWVSELILIDMASDDRTVERARPLVNQILDAPLDPNFDAARNLAIPKARNEWMWFLDADERIPSALGQLIHEVLRDPQFDALYIPFKSHFAGKWMEHCGWWPGFTMPRLLRRGCFQFRTQLHGGVDVRGRTQFLPADPQLAIEHYSYRDIEHYLEKFNRYTSTEAKQQAQEPFAWDDGVRAMVRDLWLYYERNQGQRDGQHGWILSWLAGQYRWFSHAKLLDLQGPCGSQPPHLDAVFACMRDELSQLRRDSPQLPLGIIFRSPLWDPSGYADDGRFVLSSLAQGVREMQAQEIRWSQTTCEVAHAPLLRALSRCERPKSAVAITNCIPSLAPPPDQAASLNVLRATFETDRIPEGWLPRLDAYDEVWVYSPANLEPFRRGGAAPERLRCVESGVDCDLFTPRGSKYPLPERLRGRFVFLSVFDWQLRKGWDVLLRAFRDEFTTEAGLVLKVSRVHGSSSERVEKLVGDHPGILILDETLDQRNLASLYRAVDAFVLPSRGEGWGRPYLEAMASGLPTIGTRSGNTAFMNETNSFLVDARWVDVPEAAVREIPVYADHRWLEPVRTSLRRQMRRVVDDPSSARATGRRAAKHVRTHFSAAATQQRFEEAVGVAEQRFATPSLPDTSGVRVVLEGEFFANHSFANVNEQIALGLRERVALSLDRVRHNPTFDERSILAPQLRPYFNRFVDADITIRHAFPPRLEPRPPGRWVHIQPWEYGALPLDWVEPLKSVDEVWAPSNYVKRVYEQSGIDQVVVIPWGVDPEIYNPSVPPLYLPESEFRFLFVGGTIPRKGFDLLLAAFLTEFRDDEGVSLVVKDIGTRTFYRFGNLREQVLGHIRSGAAPPVHYIDRDMTEGQRASLYAACDCLVAPYRGEGFGLPILEAMACGLAPIVPRGGASDDFVSDSTGYFVSASEIECQHDWRLCGVATELAIEVDELRSVMRQAFRNRAQTRRLGAQASKRVRHEFTWDRAVSAMLERLEAIAAQAPRPSIVSTARPTLTTCMLARDDEQTIAGSLGRIQPFSDETIVLVAGEDRSARIAAEFGCRVYRGSHDDYAMARNSILRRATSRWILSLDADEWINEVGMHAIRQAIAEAPETVHGFQLRVRGQHASQLRVLRNRNGIVFSGRVCEQPIIDGETAEIGAEIWRPAGRSSATATLPLLGDELGNGNDAWVRYQLGLQHARVGNPFHAECFFAAADNELTARLHLGTLLAIGSELQAEDTARRTFGRPASEIALSVATNGRQESARLYLGAGGKRLPGYIHVDIDANSDISWDLNQVPWPWDDNSIDAIVAEDVVEHLDIDLIQFCNEAWRVLKRNGQLFVRTPHHSGDSSWIDPTHRWHLNEQAFQYLDPATHWGQLYPQYTDRKWRIQSLGVRGPQNIHVVMVPRDLDNGGAASGMKNS